MNLMTVPGDAGHHFVSAGMTSILSPVEDGISYTPLSMSDLNADGLTAVIAIMSYRNESVIDRFLADNPECSREDAEKAWKGLLQFLTVVVFNRNLCTPSKLIDEMWHAFILHMQDYEGFCRDHLRQQVYHNPAHDDSAFVFYAVARNSVISLFGEADPTAWPFTHARYARCISCAPMGSEFMFKDYLRN